MLRSLPAKVQNGPMFDWNDLRSFLAVARTGSTLAAGRSLGVSQTTAARRVAALEEAVGLVLFERRQAGYALTAAGEALLDQARGMESAANAFAEAAASQTRDIGGVVRLTTLDIYAVTVLLPILRELHEAQPAIRIELDTTEIPRDLAAGEADVALRNSESPTGGGLVGRRIADCPWTIYCSRDYAAAHAKPHTSEDLRGHAFISGGGEGVWPPYQAWLRQHQLEESIVMHHDSIPGLLAAVRAGVGMAVLPTFVADREPDLVRCLPPQDAKQGLWLLAHERRRHVPRVRAVLDFLADRLTRLARQEPNEPAVWASYG